MSESCLSSRPHRDEGAGKAGRRRHPQSVRDRNAHGVDHRCCRSPGLPCANGFNGVLRALLGERCTIAPVVLWMIDARTRSGRSSPQDLAPEPRASGPHDFSVRAHPRWESGGWRVLAPEAMRRRCRRRVVCAESHCSRLPALQCPSRPTPSRPSLPSPRFVTIAIRPSSRARVFRVYDKTEIR